MVLHLSHAEGDFGVTFHDITKDSVFYTTTVRFVTWFGVFSQDCQDLWLSKDDLQDSSSWSSSPLLLLRDIHSKLLTQYNCNLIVINFIPPADGRHRRNNKLYSIM
jgi:hypothetical protein